MLRGGALTCVGLVGAGIVGCGSNNKNNTSSKTGAGSATIASGPRTTSTPSSGQQPGAEQPKPGGVISQRIASDPQALDIHQVSSYVAVWPEAGCYNQLLRIDPRDENDATLMADLADQWETPDGGATYVFHLHQGIKFHDGTNFSSADVKANLEWIKSPAKGKPSPRQVVLSAVTGVETPDPNTVTLKLSRPNPSLLTNLATHFLAIGPKAVIDASGDLGEKLIGTGPFKLKNYVRGDRVELERNPNYWVSARPYLDGLTYYVVPDDNTGTTNFLGGQYQQYTLTHENADRVKSETGGKASVHVSPTLTRQVIFFNTKKKPWDDIRVRQAVSLALDRTDAINTISRGDGESGGYMRSSGAWGLPVDQLHAIPGYDKGSIDQAKALLQQAGVQTPVKGTLLSRNDFNDYFTWSQQALTKIGINLDLDPRDNTAAYDAAYKGQFDLIAWTTSISLDDPDATFSEISTSDAVRNWSALNDSQVDELFKQQTQELDNAKRKLLVNQMDKRALSIFQTLQLYFTKSNYAKYSSVRDYTDHVSLYTNKRYQDVWLAK